MILKRLLYAFMLPLLVCLQVAAQDRIVTGTVTDSKSGGAITNASVLIKGTNKGTQTEADGTFRIVASGSANTLVVSSVGFTRMEVPIGSGPVSVKLQATNASLNEVVVVAYGTRKKGDLTGADRKSVV